MKKIITFITILLGSVIVFNACQKNKATNNNSTIPSGYNKNASQLVENTSYTIELYTKTKDFYVGYNNIYIAIKNTTTNEYVQNAGITIRPYMPKMPMMGMAMPCNNPTSQNADNNLFACGADFTMASNANDPMTGLWNLEVKAKLPDMADSIKAICSFNVPDTRQSISATKSVNAIGNSSVEVFANTLAINGQNYRVDMVAPREFLTGPQPTEIRIFQKIGSGATAYWKAINNESLKINNLTSNMPDMDHPPSTNNQNFEFNTKNGAYKGTINFTMTGLWDISYSLTDGTNIVNGVFTIIL